MEIIKIDIDEFRNVVYSNLLLNCEITISEKTIVINTHIYGISFSYVENLIKALDKKYKLKLVYVFSDKNLINLEFHN